MLNTFRSVVEVRMPQVFAFSCVLFDQMAARNPQNEVNLLSRLVEAGDEVCDVGANRGLFAYWFLQHGVKVTAFEPNPSMVAVLRHRFADALKRGQLRLVECALSDRAGAATLHVPIGYSGLASLNGEVAQVGVPIESKAVKVARLDDCVAGDVAFLKVDVEGHELQVFEGAANLLRASRPTILVEAEERHRPGAVASLRALLEPLGYEGFFRQGAVMMPIAAFDPVVHQDEAALNPTGTRARKGRTYINNFFFAARPQAIARLRAMAA